MKKTAREDPRLARFSEICLALPEAARESHGSYATFRVRNKAFAYYLDDHHGDGIVAVSFKAAPGENQILAGAEPKRFFVPPYVGPKGWSALRVDVGAIDWAEVAAFTLASYRLVAPKRLAAQTGPPHDPTAARKTSAKPRR